MQESVHEMCPSGVAPFQPSARRLRLGTGGAAIPLDPFAVVGVCTIMQAKPTSAHRDGTRSRGEKPNESRAMPPTAKAGTMTGTNTKLMAAVEAYLADLGRIRASGGATGERSTYGPLRNLLDAVGAALKPKVYCVGELAEHGAGPSRLRSLRREPGAERPAARGADSGTRRGRGKARRRRRMAHGGG